MHSYRGEEMIYWLDQMKKYLDIMGRKGRVSDNHHVGSQTIVERTNSIVADETDKGNPRTETSAMTSRSLTIIHHYEGDKLSSNVFLLWRS